MHRPIDTIHKYRDQSLATCSSYIDTLQSIEINPVELCNRACVFCPRADANVYRNRDLHMSEDTAHSIGKSLKCIDYKHNITFSGFGEPLLHTNIVKLIRTIKSYNIEFNRFEIITNGDFLSEQVITNLIAAGVTCILVNLYDSDDQEQEFNDLFIAADTDKFLFRHHYDSKNSYGLTLNNRAGSVDSDISPYVDSCANRPCYLSFYKVVIDWNGDYILCPQDWKRDASLTSNINSVSIEEYWSSKEISNYRDVLAINRDVSPCESCNVIGTVHGKESFEYFDILNK